MHDPFDLSDAVIRDFPHVKVTRKAPKGRRRCEYRKVFKAAGLADAGYWIRREYDFLLYFAFKEIPHVVEHSELRQGGDGTQIRNVEAVATFDAGVTIEDWLGLRPRYPDGTVQAHPFVHAGLFLCLLRACLVALEAIHRHGIVHCDIKADNICLPCQPYPYHKSGPVSIRFERIRLIDFAFSINPERPLVKPLPINPSDPRADYQSPRLKEALRRDGASGTGAYAQQLDWREDLYSLGIMAEKILGQANLLLPRGPHGLAVLAYAIGRVDWLKGFGTADLPADGQLPHTQAIAEIDAQLQLLEDLEAYQRFDLAGMASSGRAAPTAVTPVPASKDVPAEPLPEKLFVSQPSRSRRTKAAGIALAMALLAGAGAWRLLERQPTPAPRLDCPVWGDSGGMARFGSEARQLWPQVAGSADAAAVWQTLSAGLAETLARTQPSSTGAEDKARALACLAAMAEAGDADAGQRIQSFKQANAARLTPAFADWLLDLQEDKRRPMPKAVEPWFKLWRENVYALGLSGDAAASQDRALLERLGLGR